VLKYGNEGTKCCEVKLHIFFIFFLDGDKFSASGSKETAHSNNGVGPRDSHNMVMKGSPFWQSGPHTVIINLGFSPQTRQYELFPVNPSYR
jgi:hypothetical protein